MYTQEVSNGSLVPNGSGVLAADDLTAAPGVHGEWVVAMGAKIKRLMFIVTQVVLAGTTAPVVRFSKRLVPGSDTGAVVLGTLTIPSGTAVGMVLWKDIDPVDLLPGNAIKVENTVSTVDPGADTGQGLYAFECELDPETAANESNMLESA